MLYSFVVPIFNDGALAQAFCIEMASVFRRYLGHDDLARDLEVIFVDDGSKNDSPQLIKQACDEFPFAKAVLLSRNFGQHIAVSAGYRAASGDYVGSLNVDQEEPPRCLPDLLDALRKGGHDIVGGLHDGRTVGLTERMTSALFVGVMNRLTGNSLPVNATTVRIMTRRALDVYNSLTEKSRYMPGLEAWLGLKYTRVPIEGQPRKVGKSSYNFRRRLRMAYSSVISFSDFPLRLAVKFGMVVAGLGMLLAAGLLLQKLFGASLLPGYTSTFVLIVFLGGVQIAVTGVASLYIGRILAEVQQRPLFVVRETYGDLRVFDAPILHGRSSLPVVTPLPVEEAPEPRKHTA
ncbi:MAG: glycosyltransferase family 2 protein [Deltaproteobacteria bacterium]|nr:glycosyltransferase family 2 protein [Deltaproteobacteria bacterium]